MLKKVLLAILDNFEGYVSQVLLAFFVLILLLQIFLRQFGHPLYWTEELARYSFVWFVFFGASYAARLAAHNRVTIQFRPFPKWVGDACMLLSDGVWLFFNIVMVVESLTRDPRTPGIPLRHARPRLAALLYLFHLPHRLYAHVRPHHSSQRDEIHPEKRAHRARQD